MFTAKEAFDKLVAEYEFDTVLDVGCGPEALHARAFHALGKNVRAVDYQPQPSPYPFMYTQADYVAAGGTVRGFDCVWASHVLEHQQDVGIFLKLVNLDLREGGILAITVPPMRNRPRLHEIVGGHLTRWDAGLLCYSLVLAGFDCSEARWKQYDYNLSLIVKKRTIELPDLTFDCGDIERLAEFMPEPFRTERCDGDVRRWNW